MISEATRELLEIADEPGMGSVSLRKLISTGIRTYTQPRYELNLVQSGTRVDKRARAREIISRCESENIHVISPLDNLYPKRLREIKDFPIFLYVLGSMDSLGCLGVAVVGTREASRLGSSWAKQIADIIASHRMSVVSGLALGIDTAAHEGALRAGGITIAVLAHGVDQVTPSSNRRLAQQIIEFGGSLMSEHPPGTPPRKPEYVRRNRLQSGMSMCSIVVESGYEGGAIHQARFTVEQGRPLYTVTPDPSTPGFEDFNTEGSRRLMSELNALSLSSRGDLAAALRNFL